MQEIYSKYFDKNYYEETNIEPKNIDELLADENYIVSGDFYGIQKFIFERLSTQNASKVLRAKSAFIQIFTKYLAEYICNVAGVDAKHILSSNAGKFEILLPNDIDLKPIQKKIDEFFIKNYYGLSGVGVCKVKCKREDFANAQQYKKLRDIISTEVEKLKFQKLNLVEQEAVLEYDVGIDNQTLCPICNIRKGKNNCEICSEFVELGKLLTKGEPFDYPVNYFNDFQATIRIDKRFKSYVLQDKKEKAPATFETLAKNSCADQEHGIKALGILKADVDGMGNFLRDDENGVTKSFENFDTFSRVLDNFFSIYVPKNLMREKYKNSYTIFAGGDDLFLVGAWDEIMHLSREIRDEFKKFIKGKLTISFGIAIAKPSTPISYLANHTEELLEASKELKASEEFNEKDGLTIFGESVKWESYLKTYDAFNAVLSKMEGAINTTFLYRLLDFCDMSKNVNEDIKNTIWKSKLNYLFSRNIDVNYHKHMDEIDRLITHYPQESKIVLSEYIYKRREV